MPPLSCWWLASVRFRPAATHTSTITFGGGKRFAPAYAKAAPASAHLFQRATCNDAMRDQVSPANPSPRVQNLQALQTAPLGRALLIRGKAIALNAPNPARLGWARPANSPLTSGLAVGCAKPLPGPKHVRRKSETRGIRKSPILEWRSASQFSPLPGSPARSVFARAGVVTIPVAARYRQSI